LEKVALTEGGANQVNTHSKFTISLVVLTYGVWILICLFSLTNSLDLSTYIDEKVLVKVFLPFVVKLYCGMT